MQLLLILILMFLRNLLRLGKNLVDGLKNSTTTLGKIFDKDKEAKQLVADFDKSIEKQNLLITEKIKL